MEQEQGEICPKPKEEPKSYYKDHLRRKRLNKDDIEVIEAKIFKFGNQSDKKAIDLTTDALSDIKAFFEKNPEVEFEDALLKLCGELPNQNLADVVFSKTTQEQIDNLEKTMDIGINIPKHYAEKMIMSLILVSCYMIHKTIFVLKTISENQSKKSDQMENSSNTSNKNE